MKQGSIITFAVLLFAINIPEVRPQAHGGICQGQVGSIKYNLQPLSQATGGTDLSCPDQGGNTYYYRPCQPVAINCTDYTNDTSPAVCQKDSRKLPVYHDCGSTTQVQWFARNTDPKSGFTILFSGGQEGRQLSIDFICSPNGGIGQLEPAFPVEQPMHRYHLIWESSYACPIVNGDGTGDGGGGGDGLTGGLVAGIVVASVGAAAILLLSISAAIILVIVILRRRMVTEQVAKEEL